MAPTSEKHHILIAATHPLQCTGYARVGATIANGLADRGHRVTYWGFQNLAPASGRTMNPNINVLDVGVLTGDMWGFGVSQLPETVSSIECDTVVLYNDLMVVNAFLDALYAGSTTRPEGLPTLVAYIDLVHDDEDMSMIHSIVSRVDHVWVFAAHWRDSLLAMYPNASVHVVPHGIDATLLRAGDAVTKQEARRTLNIPEDAFVVVNTNRNSYRKALDLTIDGFLQFWKQHEDSVLVLNNNEATSSGYDITHLIAASCRRHGIEDIERVLNTVVLRISNGGFMPDEVLAALYTASDVGVNTCLGEGFGLCQLEGACLGAPQIATKTGGLQNILSDEPHILLDPAVKLALPRGFVVHAGTLDIPRPEDLADALRTIYDTRPVVETTTLRDRYDWTHAFDAIETSLGQYTDTS